MATKVYETKNITLFNGKDIIAAPLKIKYLHEFMERFNDIGNVQNDDEAITVLTDCIRICMKQYCPELSKNILDVEDNVDLPIIYDILYIAANIKMGKPNESSVKSEAVNESNTWQNLNLADLEAELFLTGKWKDFNELEESLSMPELTILLETKRELDYQEKKFLAAMEGVDLDKETGKSRGQQEWEDLKARVFSKGQTSDSNDVLALQGQNAINAGFGIGMGLDYENLT